MIFQEELDLIFNRQYKCVTTPTVLVILMSTLLFLGSCNAGHLLQIVILFTGCNRWSYLLRKRYGLRISLPKAVSVTTFKRSSSSERALLAKLYFKWKAKVVNRICSSLGRVMQDGSNSYIIIGSHYYNSSLAISV